MFPRRKKNGEFPFYPFDAFPGGMGRPQGWIFLPLDAFLVLKDILGKMWTEGQNPANV